MSLLIFAAARRRREEEERLERARKAKQKKEIEEKSQEEGARAFADGQSRSSNPFVSGIEELNWTLGYDKAKSSFFSGDNTYVEWLKYFGNKWNKTINRKKLNKKTPL